MVFTLANVLQMPIIIFTSVENMPVLCIMPTVSSTETTQPIFITYTQNGPGHYDYAKSVTQPQQKTKSTKCSCGRKQNFVGHACTTVRCPCIRSKKHCSHSCICKTCANKYGCRSPPSTTRRRAHYFNQKQPLCGQPGHTFTREVGETDTAGSLTLLEVLVFKAILIYFILNSLEVSVHNISFIYHKVCRVSRLSELIEFPLFDRSIQYIERFLIKLFTHLELLKSLFNIH